MSIIFWFIMMIGFSDNWLYDTGQPSNSDTIFIVHGLLAFSWFSLLVMQSGLINRQRIDLHKKIGVYSFVVFILLIPSSFAIYIEMLVEKGTIDPNGLGLLCLYIFAVILIFIAYKRRKTNLVDHKFLMLFGSFLMLRPGVDRVFNNLVDILPFIVSAILYFLTFLVFYYIFYRHRKKMEWPITTGFIIWFAGVVYGYLI